MKHDFRCCSGHEDLHARVTDGVRGTTIPEGHPVRTLVDEHDIILGVLAAMERETDLLRAKRELDSAFWLDVVDFLRNFADRCHHGKEEDLLFPAIVAAGVPDPGGPVEVMRSEHDEGRALVKRIAAAVEAGDADGVAAAAHGFTALLREHIEKENEVLFPLSVNALGEDAVERLERDFAAVEHDKMGEGTHCRYLELARSLCSRHADADD